MMKYRWMVPYCIVFCISVYASYLWFKPVMWDLAWNDNNRSDALHSIFFSTQTQESFLGSGIDLSGTIWVFDRVKQLFFGESGTFISDIFVPFGYDWGKNEGFAWADALFALPLMFFLPTPGWYNLHVLCTLTLGYFGCSVLYRKAGAPWVIAVGLAMLSLNNDFVQHELFRGRPTQIHLVFHVLFLISVLEVLGISKSKSSKKSLWLWATIGGFSGAGMLMVYWFGGVAVGFSVLIGILCMGWTKTWYLNILRCLWMAFLSIGIPLALTWRVSKSFLLGEGENLFSELSQKPAYTLDLGIWSIPIQKFKHLHNFQDVQAMFFDAKIPIFFLAMTAIFAFLNPFGWKKRWGWMLALFIALGIPMPPAIIWDGGWLINGHAFLQSVFPALLRCGFPERMVVAPILLMGIVCALSCHSLMKANTRPFGKFLTAFIICIPFFQFIPESFPSHMGTPTSHLSINPILMEATQKWPGGIIHIPLLEGSDTAHIEQMYHKQPIMGGPGIETLMTKEQKEYIEHNSFLKALNTLATSKSKNKTIPSYDTKDLEQLRSDGFRLVYINTKRTKSDAQMFQKFFKTSGMLQNSGLLAIPLPQPDIQPEHEKESITP